MAVNVVLKSVWDDKGVKNALNEFQDFGKKIGVAFAAVSAAAIGAGVAIGRFSLDAINAASALSAEFEGVNQIFGESAKAVQNFAKEASKTVGLSETAALQAAKNFGVFATSAGLAGNEASQFAIKLVQAAGDLASFNDVPVADTLAAIRSGLQGQGEPLSRFGILMSEATLKAKALEMGIIETTKNALTPQQKVIAANKLILDELGVAQGDFVKYQDTFGNRLKTVTSQFENLTAEIGTQLLPVAEEFLGSIVELTPAIGDALVPVAEELGKILADQVLPAIKDFTKWLASPQGTQTLKDLAQAVIDAIKGFVDFIGWVVQNREALGTLTAVIATLVITFKTVTGAAALYEAALVLLNRQVVTATATTTAFGTALKLLPWAALVAGATLFVTSMADYSKEVYGSKINTEGMTKAQAENAIQVENLRRLLGQYEFALKNSTAANRDLALNGVAQVRAELARTELAIRTTVGELNRFNNMNLDKIKGEIRESAGELNRFNNLLKGISAPATSLPPINIPKPATPVPATGGGGGGGGGTTTPTPTTRPVIDLPSGTTASAELINNATGILIDSFEDISKVMDYLSERITAATEFANEAAIRGQTAAAMSALETRNMFRSQAELLRSQGASAVGTVININVKTDSTQSLAMVGKTLGNTITKYVQSGGQVVVSPVG